MRYTSALLATLLMTGGTSALAQRGPPGGGLNGPVTPEGNITGYMSQGDVKGIADFVDSVSRLEAKDLVSTSAATKRSTVMLDALHIACQLTEAQHLGSGTTTVGGKPVGIGLYEVSCANGMGDVYKRQHQGREVFIHSGIFARRPHRNRGAVHLHQRTARRQQQTPGVGLHVDIPALDAGLTKIQLHPDLGAVRIAEDQ